MYHDISLLGVDINLGSSSGARKNNSACLIYECVPQYDAWLKLVLGATLALTLRDGAVGLRAATTNTTIVTSYRSRVYSGEEVFNARVS